jgi:hypothetical protein
MRKSQFQKTVAHHEAGHAVVARLLGVEIAQAFGSDGKRLKQTHHSGDAHGNVVTRSAAYVARGTPGFRAGLKADAMVALAGIAAQNRYRPQSTQFTDQTGEWEGDLKTAWFSALRYCVDHGDGTTDWKYDHSANTPLPAEVQPTVDNWLAEVTKMVEDNWPKVERVAGLLLKHSDATQDDIDAAIAEPARQDGAGPTISTGVDPQHQEK